MLKCDRGDATTRATLEREAECLDLLRHPHVVQMYRVLPLDWPSPGSIALDMEWCSGGDMLNARLSTLDMRKCFEQVLEALLAGHAYGARAITQLNIVLTCRLPINSVKPRLALISKTTSQQGMPLCRGLGFLFATTLPCRV